MRIVRTGSARTGAELSVSPPREDCAKRVSAIDRRIGNVDARRMRTIIH